MEAGYYVYDARRYISAIGAYKASNYRRFDSLEDAEAYAGDTMPIDLITVRTTGGGVKAT